MSKCPTDCVIIQDAMHLDAVEIETYINYQKQYGAKCQGCEYNEVSDEGISNTNSN